MGKLRSLDLCKLGVRAEANGDGIVLTMDIIQYSDYVDPDEEKLQGVHRYALPMTEETWENIKAQGDQVLAEREEKNVEANQ